MEAETERVNELIGQMLSLSLLESTRELQGEQLRLEEIIASIATDMRFEVASRGCTFATRVQSLPFIRGNREMLRRAIENATRNAFRHTAKSGEVT